jgi:molybdenum cofactor cytidylyltransferase
MTAAGLHAILLAAGGATRFGSPKLLAPWRGRPLLLHAIGTLLEVVQRDRLVVVLGADADRLEPLVRQTGVPVVLNPDHASGMASSLHAGLSTVPPDCAAVLIALADQVAITPDDLRRLIDRWLQQPTRVAAAGYEGVVGVPAIFPAAMFEELREVQGDRGAREVLKRRAGQVDIVSMPAAAVDVDTPADLQSLAAAVTPRDPP